MAPVVISTRLLLIAAGLATTVSGFLAPLHVKSLVHSSRRFITPNRCVFGSEKKTTSLPVQMNTLADLTDEIQVLRNELVRKDAIIEGLLSTLAKTAITTRLKPTVSSTPLTDLCQLTKEVAPPPSPAPSLSSSLLLYRSF
jgi:hypothetical protein